MFAARYAASAIPLRRQEPSVNPDSWPRFSEPSLYSAYAVGSLGATQSIDSQGDVSGYVRSELGPRATRAVVAVSGGHSSFSAWEAADLGVALSPSPRVDVALTYRPERLDYVAQTDAFLLHNLVLDLHWSVSSAFDVALSALGTTGADRDMLALLTTLAWRPLP